MATQARDENKMILTGELPVCFEVKLILSSPMSSINFANSLTNISDGTAFYRYAKYTGALSASCRRGWRMVPADKPSITATKKSNRKFSAFKLLSPWIDTDEGMNDVSDVLGKLTKISNGNACTKAGFRLHVLAQSLSCQTLVKLCQNFVKYESAIDTLVPSSRRCGSTASDCIVRSNKLALEQPTNRKRSTILASCTNVDSLVRIMNPDSKKSYKLNLQNLRGRDASFGDGPLPSIEFRQHSFTMNLVKIRSWVGLCLNMVTNSAKMCPPLALKECRSLDEEFDAFFKYMIKDKHLNTYYKKRRSELSGVKRKRSVTRNGNSRGTAGNSHTIGLKDSLPVCSSVECGCCFNVLPKSELCSCTKNNHSFCKLCVCRYVEEEIFTNHNSVIKCMSIEGCSPGSKIKEGHLKATLSKNIMQKLKDVRYDHKMRNDGYRLCECPKCETKGYVKNDIKTFQCTRESCKYKSCPLCKERDHLGQKCSEVEKEVETNARNDVEEAMASALVRKCPKCSVASIIESGCNKMTCPQCRTTWCYLCRGVTDTSTSHWSKGCSLYTNGDQTDREAVRTAGDQTTKRYSRAAESRSLAGLVQKLI